MALGALPPWLDVTPAQFVQAGNEGANAGIAAAHLRQAADQHAAQLAAEHARMQQQAALESSRLSQQQHIAEMEMQARKEIAQQNHLREQQQNLQLNAFRQSEIGLRQAQLERMQALNDAVARDKAMTYAQEAGLANHISQGGDMATGLMKFPMARGIASALKPPKLNEDVGQVEIQQVPGGRILQRHGSKEYKFLPDDKGKPLRNADGSVDLLMGDGTIKRVREPQTSTDSSLLGTPAAPAGPSIMDRVKGLFGGGMPVPPPAASPFQEGQIIHSKTDKSKVFVVKNGVPVPVTETTTNAPADTEEGNPDDTVE